MRMCRLIPYLPTRRYRCSPSLQGMDEMEPLRLEVGATFGNWQAFKDTLDTYAVDGHVQFCCVNSRTVATANKLLAVGSMPYKSDLKYAYIRLGCKHYGNPRKEGRGIRNNQT